MLKSTKIDLSAARAEEIRRWVGNRATIGDEHSLMSLACGSLESVHISDSSLPPTMIYFDFGEDGMWQVEPELVTLPTDDGPRWFSSFIPYKTLTDNMCSRREVFIMVHDEPAETEAT